MEASLSLPWFLTVYIQSMMQVVSETAWALKFLRTASDSWLFSTLLFDFGRAIVGESLPMPWLRTMWLPGFLNEEGVSRR